jgi:uncharacterized coiled-coil DUF342 family protein
MTPTLDLHKPKERVLGIISEMQAMATQIGAREDLIKENATLRAQGDILKRDVASTKTELSEVMHELNKRRAEVQEVYRQLDQAKAEIREKTTMRDKLNAEVQALRQRYFGG